MPLHWTKHEEEGIVELNNFFGGLNVSVPRTLIADNEAEWIENFYIDPADGRLVTRWPVVQYSNSAPVTSPVTGIYYWNDTWYLTINQVLYYLDSSLDPTSIGNLNGSGYPVFCPYNGKLVIASGSTLQSVTTANVIADVSNAPKGSYIFQKDSRLVVSGDPDNKDRVWQCAVFDETSWSAGSDDYADVGYLDKLSVMGIYEAFDGLYLVFKRGDSELKTFFLTSLSEATPSCKLVSKTHCTKAHRSIVDAGSKVYFLEDKDVVSILGTDVQGKLVVNPATGIKISGVLQCGDTCHAVVYPPDKQIWFFPEASYGKVYICHYMREDAWTVFDFDDFQFNSAFYRPSDRRLYLGAQDGYIYRYEHNEYNFKDGTPGDPSTRRNFTQYLRSKSFDSPPHKEKVLKDPRLFYEGLQSGSAVFEIRKNYGKTSDYNNTWTVTSTSLRLYDTQTIYLYNTQARGNNEMYLYDTRSSVSSKKWNENRVVDNFQFYLTVSSGALKIDKFVALLAAAQKR